MRIRAGLRPFALLAALALPAFAQERGGQLSYSSMQQVVAYEPISNVNLASAQLAALMFETLVERNPRSSGVVPVLAESFRSEPESITFSLRRNVLWHDGRPLTAQDVQFSVELIQHPRSVTPLRDEFAFIRAVEVIDPYTVRFQFRQAMFQPESYFVSLPIVSRHPFRVFELDRTTGQDIYLSCRLKDIPVHEGPSVESREVGLLQPKTEVLLVGQQNDWYRVRVLARGTSGLEGWTKQFREFLGENEPVEFFTQPVGTGPYRFSGVDGSGNVVLDAHVEYHAGAPRINRIRRRRSSDKNTMINRLISDVLDLVPETPFEDIARIRGSGVCQTIEYPSLKFAGFAHNLRHPLLARREARRAMSFALDREELLQTFYQGLGTVLAGPFSPHSWGYDFELTPLPYDLAQARNDLNLALAQPGTRAPLRILVAADRKPEDHNLCQAFATVLRELGLEAEVVTLERSVFDEKLRNKDFDVAYLEWTFDYAYNIRPLFYPGGALNLTGYDSPEVAAAFDRLDHAASQEARYEEARAVQRLLREDCPYTFLWATKNIASVNRKVSNIKSSNIDPYSFFEHVMEWWISEVEE